MALLTDLDQGVTNGGDEQQFGQQRRWTTSDAVTLDGRMAAASSQNPDDSDRFHRGRACLLIR
jgi:hypothetical protein